MQNLLDVSGITFLIAVICFYYGIRTIMTKDVTMFRGKTNVTPMKDEAKYARGAGIILCAYGFVNVLAGAIMVVAESFGIAIILLGTAVLLVSWFYLNRKYGA